MKGKSILLICAILTLKGFLVNAQNASDIDSLKSKKILEKVGAERFDMAIDLLVLNATVNIDTAMSYGIRAREIAFELEDSLKIALSYRMIGQLENWKGNGKKGEEHLLIALDYCQAQPDMKTIDERVKIFNSLGVSATYLANYGLAIDYYLQGLDLANRAKDSTYIATINLNLGLLYYKLNNPAKAIDYYEEGIPFMDTDGQGNALANIGLAFHALKQCEKAKLYFRMATRICAGLECTDKTHLNIIYSTAVCLYHRGLIQESIPIFEEALALSLKIKDDRFQAECLVMLAKINLQEGFKESTHHMLAQAKELCLRSGNREILADVFETFVDYNLSVENFKEASMNLARLIIIEDSIQNMELQNTLRTLEVELAQRENKTKVQSQARMLTLQESVMRKQKVLAVVSIVSSFFLVLLLVLLWNYLRQKTRFSVILSKKVKERSNELERKLNVAAEKQLKERNSRLAILHDLQEDITALEKLSETIFSEIQDPRVRKEFGDQLSRTLTTLSSTVQRNS